eukprot:TRINITY_DN64551_c0_g1_i1.p3 TRINITY_DN64551_c0_g1~~TRINITY_DN64551_c0_g1_i1.p3  ORF type:complete len:208 (-),score=24.37 TRINITY_DN64551_c0_g1_i1:1132-1755(-)
MKQKLRLKHGSVSSNIAWQKMPTSSNATERIANGYNNHAFSEIEQTKEYAITKFAKDLLDVQDNFKRALDSVSPKELEKHAKDPEAKIELYTKLVEGISMTKEIMAKAFKKYGVTEYVPLGEKFDPNLHEAMFEYPDSKKTPGTVGEVVQAGYKIGKRILRAPKVGVVKKLPVEEKGDKQCSYLHKYNVIHTCIMSVIKQFKFHIIP